MNRFYLTCRVKICLFEVLSKSTIKRDFPHIYKWSENLVILDAIISTKKIKLN